MTALPREVLTSERGTDDLWHARYPSATETLCGRTTVGPQAGRKWPPTCGRCGKIARRLDKIDASMPARWRLSTDECPASRDFLAERVQQLEDDRMRLIGRLRKLEASRDLWRQRAMNKARVA